MPVEVDEGEEMTDSVSLRFRKHDRRHVQLKLEYPASARMRGTEEVDVEVWIFFPTAADFWSDAAGSPGELLEDVRVRTRLKTPAVSLATLCHLDGERSPLASVGFLLEQSSPGKVPGHVRRVLQREVRMFACMARRSLKNAVKGLKEESTEEGVESFLSECRALRDLWRRQAEILAACPVGHKVRETVRSVDEAVSIYLEGAALDLLFSFDERLDDGERARFRAIVLAEQAHRKLQGYRSAMSSESMDTPGRGLLYDQMRLLKRATALELALDARPNGDAKLLEQLSLALAAAVAMVWTVGLQLVTLFVLDLELHRSVTMRAVLWFTSIMVVGYALKDRLKAWLGATLASRVPHAFYDRRSDLFKRGERPSVGWVRESVRIEHVDQVSDVIHALRRRHARVSPNAWADGPVLYYRRRVSWFPKQLFRIFPRLEGLTEFVRFDVERWIRGLDRRAKTVFVLGSDKRVREVEVANVYTADVVVRTRRRGRGTNESVFVDRVVMSEEGVERVYPLEG